MITEKIFYLPVTLTSHNGGSGSHSYFAVRPANVEDWPLSLSPDQKSLLYIHPRQLIDPESGETLETIITSKRADRHSLGECRNNAEAETKQD